MKLLNSGRKSLISTRECLSKLGYLLTEYSVLIVHVCYLSCQIVNRCHMAERPKTRELTRFVV